MKTPTAGTFVALHGAPLRGKQSARVGWIVAENGCHIWQGTCTANGYGRVRVEGGHQLVHRVRYEREVGPIPEGMILDHYVCDTRRCCNPEHVRPVAHRENSLRGATVAAAHAAKTHCPQGHPYAGDNLLVERSGRRYCRTCRRIQTRSLRQRTRRAARPSHHAVGAQ